MPDDTLACAGVNPHNSAAHAVKDPLRWEKIPVGFENPVVARAHRAHGAGRWQSHAGACVAAYLHHRLTSERQENGCAQESVLAPGTATG